MFRDVAITAGWLASLWSCPDLNIKRVISMNVVHHCLMYDKMPEMPPLKTRHGNGHTRVCVLTRAYGYDPLWIPALRLSLSVTPKYWALWNTSNKSVTLFRFSQIKCQCENSPDLSSWLWMGSSPFSVVFSRLPIITLWSNITALLYWFPLVCIHSQVIFPAV